MHGFNRLRHTLPALLQLQCHVSLQRETAADIKLGLTWHVRVSAAPLSSAADADAQTFGSVLGE